ncbi:putative defense protein 3 [Arctopsyche grandis]|uniref:putative defense protein 3 n=1 Tax=Arctopsyche grandis TaxID=121162 RepID=UPI00406D8FC5
MTSTKQLSRVFIAITMVIAFFATSSLQYSTGAPSEACITMLPHHGAAVPQSTLSPYSFTVSSSHVVQGSNVKVLISTHRYKYIKGFILQARCALDQNRILGHWTNLSSFTKTTSCNSKDDTVTHVSNVNKQRLPFQWNAPPDFLGAVIFTATIAENFDIFWNGVKSNSLFVTSDLTTSTTSETSPKSTFTISCSQLTIQNNTLICKLKDGPLDMITWRK